MNDELPVPPDHPRRVRWHTLQLIGILLLLLLPLLSLAGVFGIAEEQVQASSGALTIDVQYTSRLRYKQHNVFVVHITNTSGRPVQHITVLFDPAYFSGYEDLAFIPAADRRFAIELGSLAPGAARQCQVQGKAEHYGTTSGILAATTADGDSVAVTVQTIVFP